VSLSYVQYVADGTTDEFDVPFPFVNRTHVKVYVNGVPPVLPPVWIGASRIKLANTITAGALVEVRRETPLSTRLVDFQNGSVLTEEELDTALNQVFYLQQELNDKYGRGLAAAITRVATANGVVSVQPEDAVAELANLILEEEVVSDLRQALSDIDVNAASIASEVTARAGGDSALASQITTLTASVSSNSAAITTEQAARAAADGALATKLSELSVAVATPSLSLDFLTGTYSLDQSSTLSARITDESNARISGNTALAQQITSLTTTVNGNTASITTLSSSVNGLQARYGVSLDVNGYVTGFIQNNNGTSGTFTVLADKFSIVAPGGGTPVTPFSVTAGEVRINGNLIVSGSITTNGLASGSVTRSAVHTPSGSLTLSGSWQEAATVTLDVTSGSNVKIDFSARIAGTATTTSLPVEYRIKRAGTVIRSGTIEVLQQKQVITDYVSSVSYEFVLPIDSVRAFFHLDTTPSSGNTTYSIELKGDAAVGVTERQMLATELRR
jgi:hypothetical protein